MTTGERISLWAFSAVATCGLGWMALHTPMRAANAAGQQAATMKLQTDGPSYSSATFQVQPAGSTAVTNAGPSGVITMGGSLLSLGTQTITVSYPGAVVGDRYACGVGSTTASSATLLALEPVAIVVSADQVIIGVRNGSTGLLAATNVINISCSTKLN